MRCVVFMAAFLSVAGAIGPLFANSLGQSLRPIARPIAPDTALVTRAAAVRPQLRPQRLASPVQSKPDPKFQLLSLIHI